MAEQMAAPSRRDAAALGALAALWPTTALAQVADPLSSAAASPWALAALGGLGTLGGALAWRGGRRRTREAAARGEARATALTETLEAVLLDHADGAALWSGRRLVAAGGVAEALDALGPEPAPEAAAAMLADADDAPGLADRLRALLDEGHGFEATVAAPGGEPRRLAGRTVGARALLSILDNGGETVSLPRIGAARMGAGERQLHDAVRAAQELAQSLDHAPVHAWRRDETGRLTWVNAPYAQVVEAGDANAVLDGQVDLTGERSGVARGLAARARAEGRAVRERVATVIAGERRHLQLQEIPVVGGTIGFASDVTALAESAEELRRHIEANEATLDKLQRGVAVFSKDLRLSYFNDAIAQQWAASAAWLESHPHLSEVLNGLREAGKVPQTRDFAGWRKGMLERFGKLSGPYETHWHLSNGETFHLLAQPHPLGGLLLVFEDVTDFFELKRDMATVSAVQRAAFSRLHEGVLVLGLDGKRRLSNTAFEAMWELRPEQLQGAHIREIAAMCTPLYDEDRVWSQMIEHVSGATEARRPWSEHLHRKDGTVLSMVTTVLPDGATMFAYTDVTDSVTKERVLRDQNLRLEETSGLKSAFIDTIHDTSQELKIPLNSIVGFAALLDTPGLGPLTDKQREYVDGVREAADQLAQIVTSMTDLATIQADDMPFRVEPVDLPDTLEASARFVERSAARPISLRVSVEPGVAPLPTDATRFREIVHHLVTGVLGEAADAAASEVEIGAMRENDRLLVWVGPIGAPLSTSTRMLFSQRAQVAESATVRRNALGVSLVRRFVNRQGGRVALRRGLGATDEALVCSFLADERAVREALERDVEGRADSDWAGALHDVETGHG